MALFRIRGRLRDWQVASIFNWVLFSATQSPERLKFTIALQCDCGAQQLGRGLPSQGFLRACFFFAEAKKAVAISLSKSRAQKKALRTISELLTLANLPATLLRKTESLKI